MNSNTQRALGAGHWPTTVCERLAGGAGNVSHVGQITNQSYHGYMKNKVTHTRKSGITLDNNRVKQFINPGLYHYISTNKLNFSLGLKGGYNGIIQLILRRVA